MRDQITSEVRVGGACGPPPPVAAPLASSLRAPFRGDPPLEGGFAQLLRFGVTRRLEAATHGANRVTPPVTSQVWGYAPPRQTPIALERHDPELRPDGGSTYAGGRRGKERAASLRAQQRLASGALQAPRPGPRTYEVARYLS